MPNKLWGKAFLVVALCASNVGFADWYTLNVEIKRLEQTEKDDECSKEKEYPGEYLFENYEEFGWECKFSQRSVSAKLQECKWALDPEKRAFNGVYSSKAACKKALGKIRAATRPK